MNWDMAGVAQSAELREYWCRQYAGVIRDHPRVSDHTFRPGVRNRARDPSSIHCLHLPGDAGSFTLPLPLCAAGERTFSWQYISTEYR